MEKPSNVWKCLSKLPKFFFKRIVKLYCGNDFLFRLVDLLFWLLTVLRIEIWNFRARFKKRLNPYWVLSWTRNENSIVNLFLFSISTGVSDEVKCFHCDGGLRGWEPNDNAWVEHAKWFPHCKHVILLKGKDFVEEIVKKNVSIFWNSLFVFTN